MSRSRSVLAGMLVLVLVALAVPAVSLAGGSAGDQQYTDPFSGGSGGSGSQSSGTTSPAPASATTTSSSPVPAQTTASPAPATTPPSTADPKTAAQPTATIARSSSPTLPATGYDAWTAVGFGLTLAAGGVALRWRVRARHS